MGLTSAMTTGLLMGGLSAGSTFLSSVSSSAQQRAQAEAMSSQADQQRAQAKLRERSGAIEAEQMDARKIQLRREYERLSGENRNQLAAANVDLTSGSPSDVAQGNINLFANDWADNAYSVALKKYETAEQAKQARYQADLMDSRASFMQRTAGNIGTSLLTSLASGTTGFLNGYMMGGGKLASLFGEDLSQTSGALWDVVKDGKLYMRHASGWGKVASIPIK